MSNHLRDYHNLLLADHVEFVVARKYSVLLVTLEDALVILQVSP